MEKRGVGQRVLLCVSALNSRAQHFTILRFFPTPPLFWALRM
jgi:hypothetical protein